MYKTNVIRFFCEAFPNKRFCLEMSVKNVQNSYLHAKKIKKSILYFEKIFEILLNHRKVFKMIKAF